jgi:hypothetical protein
MIRVYFKDEGQDCLWWDIENGEVVACDMQAWAWVGTRVDMKKDLRVDNKLDVTFTDGSKGTWKHPIEKIERPPAVAAG